MHTPTKPQSKPTDLVRFATIGGGTSLRPAQVLSRYPALNLARVHLIDTGKNALVGLNTIVQGRPS